MSAGREIPVSRLREAVEARVRATSRRRTASEVGLSPRGLYKFLEGATPHPATVRKLEQWYRDHGSSGDPSVLEALDVLISYLPQAQRAAGAAELTGLLREFYETHRVRPPPALCLGDDGGIEADGSA